MAHPGPKVPGIFGWTALAVILATPASAQSPSSPPQVRVAPVEAAQVEKQLTYPGMSAAVRTVDLRAQVDGLLQSRHFEEGRPVATGDILFTMDPASWRLAVTRAEASVESAAATLRFTEAETARYARLSAGGAASEERRQQTEEQRDTARAELTDARAALATARLDLSRTQIRAPFSGRADRALVHAGDYISSGATPLVRLTQLNPIRIEFSPAAAEAALIIAALADDRRNTPALPASIALPGDPDRRFAGSVDYAASGIDPATGTLPMSATFSNPDHGLRPGAFTPITIHLPDRPVLLVPEEAIYGSSSGPYVVVVKSGALSHVPVETGERHQNRRIVHATVAGALSAGSMVVVSDATRLPPGTMVQVATGGDAP